MTDRSRVRLLAVTVVLEAVADDGEMLHPIDTRPIRVPAAEWSEFSLDVILGQLQSEIEPTP